MIIFNMIHFSFIILLDYVIRNTPVKEKKILPYLTKPLNGFTLSLYDTVYKKCE